MNARGEPLTREERAYLIDHLDVPVFRPVVRPPECVSLILRGCIEDVGDGWCRVSGGMRIALRASLARDAIEVAKKAAQ